LAYFTETLSDIQSRIVNSIQSNSAISRVSPGSNLKMLIDQFAANLFENQASFTTKEFRTLVNSASGEFLDAIGRLVQIRRGVGKSASGEVKISYGAISNNIVIPKGTMIRFPAGVLYTTESVTLTSDATVKHVYVDTFMPGDDMNIPAGTPLTMLFNEASKASIVVTCEQSIDGAGDTESDDNYRFRILNSPVSNVAGNETSIRMAALSIPGVSDVVIIPKTRGIGTTEVFVKSTAGVASDSLLREVKIAVDRVCSCGENVYVSSPNYLFVDITLTVKVQNLANKISIDALIKTSLEEFINNLEMGDIFSIDQLDTIASQSSNAVLECNIDSVLINDITANDYMIKNNFAGKTNKFISGNITVNL